MRRGRELDAPRLGERAKTPAADASELPAVPELKDKLLKRIEDPKAAEEEEEAEKSGKSGGKGNKKK